VESVQPERAEVDVPFAVVDLDEPDRLLAQGLTDVDPLVVPADPAVATDAADLIVAGIVQRGEASRIRAWGRGVDRR
jgi:hypothetical protein